MVYRKNSDFYVMLLGGKFVTLNPAGLRVDFDTLAAGSDSVSFVCRASPFGSQRVLCRREFRGLQSYWYGFALVSGRLRKVYIGKDLDYQAVFGAAFRFYFMSKEAF